jgi:Ca2+:H+ antiporter
MIDAMSTSAAAPPKMFVRSDYVILGGGALACAFAGVTRYVDSGPVVPFVASAVAVALLASLVGRSVEQLGDRFGAGATGVLQSALGNLPELFIGYFALRVGLVAVVQAAIIGSILSNALLVLGLAFLVGGLRHGTQRFNSHRARTTCVLLALATAALVLPSLAASTHVPAGAHETALSVAVSMILLLVFGLSLPAALRRQEGSDADAAHPTDPPRWPVWLAVALLAAASVLAALVSDWFVHALEPAIEALHISPAFAGLVIVAIAGNAVENTTGLLLAAKGQSDLAISVVKNSVAQIAVFLFPALILVSLLLTHTLTFVLPPIYIASLALSAIAIWQITGDGEAREYEGAALIALFVMVAAVAWFE